jgi:tRNA(Ile)-lysidine synthase
VIRLLGTLPTDIILACSGGPDSMGALDFLSRRRRNISVAYFDHGTPSSQQFLEVVREFTAPRGLELLVGCLTTVKGKGQSQEEHWRNARYAFLDDLSAARQNIPIVTCHHLDDQVETWIWSSLHGNPRLIPYKRGNVIRPFLQVRKESLRVWCEDHDVRYIDDPSNDDTVHIRNLIRKEIVPQALRVNPGLHKVVKKLVIRDFEGSAKY